ncbi:MAG TPA: general stress protein [Pirellulales bacterium]
MAVNTYSERSTVVGVFEHQSHAQDAVRELKARGFRDDQIGVVARDGNSTTNTIKNANESESADMAAVGATAGAGVGALWALGIAANLLPAIGPVIAGGILANVLASAVGGAAVAGLAGALVGLGVPKDEADYYHSEFQAGRTLVTVRAEGRNAEAYSILQHNGAYDLQSKDSYQTTDVYREKLRVSPPVSTLNSSIGSSSVGGTMNQTAPRTR